jgi:hypothetical protein
MDRDPNVSARREAATLFLGILLLRAGESARAMPDESTGAMGQRHLLRTNWRPRRKRRGPPSLESSTT